MLASSIYVILASAGLIEASLFGPTHNSIKHHPRDIFARQNQPNCLQKDLIQSASSRTGQEPGTPGAKAGQSPSATDNDNFINFCRGQTITNGAQIKTGSCNGIPMGKLPSVDNMISAMITNPQPGKTIPAETTFTISVQVAHLKAGVFVNPTTNYYSAPQDLDSRGDIIGHCHVTVQSIGSFDSTTPPDPKLFAFFKGIDDAGNGQGLLQAVVTGGLPPGVYRVCTLIGTANHQPVAMPVAQRGAQDDCTKFEVIGDGQGQAKGNNGQGQGQTKDKNGQAQGNSGQTQGAQGKIEDQSGVYRNGTQGGGYRFQGQPDPANGGKGNKAAPGPVQGGRAQSSSQNKGGANQGNLFTGNPRNGTDDQTAQDSATSDSCDP